MHFNGPTLSSDVESAEWIRQRLDPALGVGAFVPTGYDAYARVLHPVHDQERDEVLTWAQVAAETGRTVHPLVQWHRLVGSDDPYGGISNPDWDRGQPEKGALDPEALNALLRVLIQHTATPDDCWFCVWRGYNFLDPPPTARHSATSWSGVGPPLATTSSVPTEPVDVVGRALVYSLPREYLLFHGRAASAPHLGEVNEFGWFSPRPPNVWWPEDHAWCVASEIDFDSTLVGGSAALIDALLDADDLEVWRVDLDDSLACDADQVN